MSRIVMDPPKDDLKIHGILAHVSAQERERILDLPYGEFKPAIKMLERDLKTLKKMSAELRNKILEGRT